MITFYNKSLLPLECIKTFGVSVKENEHPIGYFGTGLKYAIAVLLREGCKVRLYLQEENYEPEIFTLSTSADIIRGKTFNLVYMNDLLLPFTTELGKNWELWQAYRELYSNCMDEGGEVVQDDGDDPLRSGTSIVVEGLDTVHVEREKFILSSLPKHRLDGLEIHESDEPAVFYKGIKVLELKSKFSYNILSDIKLTEDRTASQWDVNYAIAKAVSESNNVAAISDVLTVPEADDLYESKIDYSRYVKPSVEFMRLVHSLKTAAHNVRTYYNTWEPKFSGGLPKEALSKNIQDKLLRVQQLMTFRPAEIFVMNLVGEDFRVIDEGLCLDIKLMHQPKKLAFVYCLACCKMQNKGSYDSNYETILKHMLHCFDPSKMKVKPRVKKIKEAA